MRFMLWTITLAFFVVTSHVNAEYTVGVGIADMTGPAAEINMVLYYRENSCGRLIL